MAEDKKSGFCKACDAQRVVFRKAPNHVLHLILTVITFGFWVIVWVGVSVRFGGWRCAQCGSKRIAMGVR